KDQALRQLGGALSETYAGWRASLLQVLALLEAAIDFPDEDDAPDNTEGPVHKTIRILSNEIETALADDHVGERIRDGFRVAIVGPPNVGKSSLLNHLAGRPAAIVTDIPGTTRDVVEVRRVIAGAVVWFLDTAGLRDTDDVVEAEGVRRAKAAAGDADLRLHIVDGASPEPPEGDVRGEDIIVFNKADLASDKALPDGAVSISAITGAGLDQLDQTIADWVSEKVTCNEPALITRQRHRAGLASGLESLKAALAGLESGLGAELVAEDVRMATRALDALLGTVSVEDVLGAVFSQFCIGK
ncbi:MAG: GTPase, partial [Pseudomonadota bacterium]